jgi:RNA polymerase sigma-70 factor (ECF subfamily)
MTEPARLSLLHGLRVETDDLPSDADLIHRFKTGDETAFNEIVRRYQKRLYAVALRMVRDHDVACDLSQEAFIRAYEGLKGFREDASLFTWLYRIVVNLGINRRRVEKVRRFISLDDLKDKLVADRGNPSEDVDDSELRGIIKRAVDALPERQRAIFILRQYEGLQHQEIAEILGRSVGAIKAGYFHAVRKLREELKEFVE